MPFDRRAFLKLAWGFRLSRAGLGRVVFCRASRNTADWLPVLFGGKAPVCEAIERDELVLCGTKATLVIDARGWRRFA